ncbi:MAG: glycosyltransferase [Nitrospirota bacterium]|nr:glycosyltransferase [Nitrospirota bacterium]
MNMFHDNVKRLALRYPDLADSLIASAGGILSIEPSRSGVPSARRSGRWIHSAYDPIREADTWADTHAPGCQPGETVVIAGVGLLYHVEALRKQLPPDIAVAVLIPNIEEFHDALSSRSLGPWSEQIAWLFNAPSDIAQSLTTSGQPVRCLSYAPASQADAGFHNTFEQALRRDIARRAGGQLTIALVGPIYGGSLPIARYVKRALEILGHKVQWIDHSPHAQSYEVMGTLKDARNRQMMQSRMAEVLSQWTLATLAESPPDLVLSLAQAPLTLPVLEHLRKKKFLTAMWFVENYRHLTYWQQMAPGYEFWFVFQQGECPDAFRRAGARQVNYLPMAADPDVHSPLELSDVDRRYYGADVSFVGAGYANRRRLFPALLRRPWSFKLWGNEWEGADDLRSVLQLEGARIDTATCMKVFNATTINVNLHSTTDVGLDPQADFVNPRTFELASCGAFQLVDHRSLLAESFTEREIVSFRTFEEVPGLAERWLGDSAARQEMAAAARARVVRAHTYVHRMKDLLAQIGLSQPDRVGAVLRGDRQQEALVTRCADDRPLESLLKDCPAGQRVELKDVAAKIRTKGPSATLTREELMVLMLDEYRSETRDLV